MTSPGAEGDETTGRGERHPLLPPIERNDFPMTDRGKPEDAKIGSYYRAKVIGQQTWDVLNDVGHSPLRDAGHEGTERSGHNDHIATLRGFDYVMVYYK